MIDDLLKPPVSPLLKTEKAVEPAKRWRNKWLTLRAFRYLDREERRTEGEVYFGRSAWPSKEVAEQRALDTIAEDIKRHGHVLAEHLGAFPEGHPITEGEG